MRESDRMLLTTIRFLLSADRSCLASVRLRLAALIPFVSLATMIGTHAHADPLSLTELNRFNEWVQCTENCRADQPDGHPYADPDNPTYVEQRGRFQCLATCGTPSHLWVKDGGRADES